MENENKKVIQTQPADYKGLLDVLEQSDVYIDLLSHSFIVVV